MSSRATIARGCLLLAVIAAAIYGAAALFRSPVEDLADRRDEQRPETGRAPISAPARPPQPSQAYVGSQLCAECHSDVFERYRRHPMFQSLANVDEAVSVEDFSMAAEFIAPPSPYVTVRVRYYAVRDPEPDAQAQPLVESPGDSGLTHHEEIFIPDGESVYDQTVPIHYSIGAGLRSRSYLTNRAGLLYLSPLSWYSRKHPWSFSPGYYQDNQHFERRVGDDCLSCHAGRMNAADDEPDRYHEQQPFLEESIGCERCHGPGEAHVAFRRSGRDTGPDPIVNPAALKPEQRDAVCWQCHLTGEERIPRYGRSHFDFRPGDDVLDIWTVFVPEGGSGGGVSDTASHPEQMLASACYRRSDGRLGCVSCHDPHAVPAAEERIGYYRERCLQCHAADGTSCELPTDKRIAATPADSCIECHMPRIAANDEPHAPQTDHRVPRSPAGLRGARPRAGRTLRIFGGTDEKLPQSERDRARGLLLVLQAERSEDAREYLPEAISRLKPWVQAVPDDLPAAEMLGTAYAMSEQLGAAYEVWHAALQRAPDHEGLLGRLAVTCHEDGRIEEALGHSRRLVERTPWNHMHQGRLAHMLAQRGEFQQAIEAGERAVEIRPSDFWARGWLAEVYRRAGQPERARAHEAARDLLGPRSQR